MPPQKNISKIEAQRVKAQSTNEFLNLCSGIWVVFWTPDLAEWDYVREDEERMRAHGLTKLK